MTAEIAILNRAAIALAADSAVTITVAGRTKVYDTAEKLFELSKRQPIGLMIYNNVEYVGVPLDVLTRRFRNEQDAAEVTYSTVQQASDVFLDYLKSFDHDVSEEKRYLFVILKDAFSVINESMQNEVMQGIDRWIEDNTFKRLTSTEILQRKISEALEIQQGLALKGYLSKVGVTAFRAAYSDVVESAISEAIKMEVTPDVKKGLEKLALALVKSGQPSDLRTGLVFGGFAEKDMFPTLRYLEVDGIFLGELKILTCSEIDIDRKSIRAAVVPFAQKEMVERFMFGLDSGLENDIATFVSNVVDEVVEATGKAVDKDVEAEIKSKVSGRFRGLLGKLKDGSEQDLLDIVYFMSKKELADIAHALVELTSHKRRFSTDQQTVGGPIDVAILTKNEGFIWIQRKHYFGSDINGGYAVRTGAA